MRFALLILALAFPAEGAIDPIDWPMESLQGFSCRQLLVVYREIVPLERERREYPYRRLYIDLENERPDVETARITHPAFAELTPQTQNILSFLVIVGSPSQLMPIAEAGHFKNQPPFLRGTLDESERKLSEPERAAAELLLIEGWSLRTTLEGVVQDQRCPEGQGVRFLEDLSAGERGVELKTAVEIKTLVSADSSALVNRVMESLKKGGQAPFILVDVRQSGMTMDEAYRGIMRLRGLLLKREDLRARGYHNRLNELRVVGEGFEWDVIFKTERSLLDQVETFLSAFENGYQEDIERLIRGPE